MEEAWQRNGIRQLQEDLEGRVVALASEEETEKEVGFWIFGGWRRRKT
jgi:hypothetical protein